MFTPKMEKKRSNLKYLVKNILNHSRGFTIPEAMIACALGVGVVLLVAKFMQNAPDKQVEKARERLEVAANSYNMIERLVTQINNSQILKTELIECNPQSLSPDRNNAVTTTTIKLDDPSDQSFNLVTSVHSELVMANTKSYEVTTVSPESFKVGDIVALTQKDNSAIGAIFVIKKITNNILTLDRSLSVPIKIGCNINNSKVSDFDSLLTTSGLKLDKIELISYRFQQNERHKDKMDLVYYELYNTQRPVKSHVALNNIVKLNIVDTWTPFSQAEAGQTLGKMEAKIEIDYLEEGQTGATIQRNLKSYAGYRYTASTRINFAIDVDSKPVDTVSCSCMVVAKQETPAIVLPDDPDNYHKFITLTANLSDDDDVTGPVISAKVMAGSIPLDCYKNGAAFGTNNIYKINLTSDNEESNPSSSLIFGYNTSTHEFEEYICTIPPDKYDPSQSYNIIIKTAKIQFFDPNTETTVREKCSTASVYIKAMPDPEIATGKYYLKGSFKCRQKPGEIYSYAKLAYNSTYGLKYGPELYPLCLWEGSTEYTRNCDAYPKGEKRLLSIKIAPFNLLPSPWSKKNHLIVNCY